MGLGIGSGVGSGLGPGLPRMRPRGPPPETARTAVSGRGLDYVVGGNVELFLTCPYVEISSFERRLAKAPEAVAELLWAGLSLGVPSCPEPPGAP